MAEKRPLAFIRSTICPESNSNVKREMRIFGDRGDLLKKRIVTHSGLRSPLLLFPIRPVAIRRRYNNDYYCNPSVPLIKHCGNVQKGALLPCCRAFCSTWPPIVGGAGRALTGDSIRFPIPSHRTRLYQDGGGPSVQHNPPRDYEESVKNRGQSRQILLRFSLLWRADTSVHRPIFCIFAPGI